MTGNWLRYIVLTMSSTPTGQDGDHAIANTLQNNQVNSASNSVANAPPGDVHNLPLAVLNRRTNGGDIYDDILFEDVTVQTPAVTAFTGGEHHSNQLRQRDRLLHTQPTAATIIDGNEDVETYYDSLEYVEQYIVCLCYAVM